MKLGIALLGCCLVILLFVPRTYFSTKSSREVGQHEMPEPIEKYDKSWIPYAVVNKANDYSRRMYLEAGHMGSLGNPSLLPDGTLIAMETWIGEHQSRVYIGKLKDGEWLNGSFDPSRSEYTFSKMVSCNRCHSNANNRQATYTRELLFKSLKSHEIQKVTCNKSSFSPCSLSTYE